MRQFGLVAAFAGAIACIPALTFAASVNISGSHSTGAYETSIDTSVLFDPNSGPVSVSGSIDLSNLGSSGVLFIGLISKVDFDHHNSISSTYFPDFRYFIDTAYASFRIQPRAGLGQYLEGGEDTQAYVSGIVNPIESFEAEFGDTSMSLTVQGNSTSRNYDFSSDNLTFTSDGSPYTDFSEGAYAFVGTYNGGTSFDVAFEGPDAGVVPIPAALPLFASGFALFGGLAGWRRRRV